MGEPALIAGITRQIMADYASTRGASTSPACRRAARWRRSWARPIPISMPASACTRALPAARPATCRRPLRRCGAIPRRAPANLPAGGGHAVPTIVFHGDRDTTVHPRNGAQIVARPAAMCRFYRSRRRLRGADLRARCAAMPADAACSNGGRSTALGMHGRAAARLGRSPIRPVPTRRARCCASSLSMRAQPTDPAD